MADVGAAALGSTLSSLIPLGESIVTRLRGVEAKIKSMDDELETIRVCINQAERSDNDDMMKDWVKKARKVCFRIEDVIDEYLFIEEKHRPRRRLVRVVYKMVHLLKTVKPRYDIASEIADIKNSINELYEKRPMIEWNINPSTPESSSLGAEISTRHGLRLGALFMDDAELVGVDKTKTMLTDWLLKGEKKRTVITVVGEGGSGKTTIVNNVYKNQKEAFESFAWITVSRPFKEEKILKTMMESFCVNSDAKKSTEVLTEKLKEYLEKRKYLVVFDDVWEANFWEYVKNALPNNDKSSRIMITTRDKSVAEYCKRSPPAHIHALEPLPPKDALSLLHRTAFNSDDNEGCPEELLELSKKLVKKCSRVPLAIVTIGGLLSTKRKTVSEWKKVHDILHSKLASEEPDFKRLDLVLSESYNDLSYRLKLCLLSFGLFPEDHSISCVRLINLWIAEGFVKGNENQTLVQIADQYLDELISRSLVKVSEVYPYERVRRCRVHDLMHSFILKKCEELNFCQVTKQSANSSSDARTRHLSIQTNDIIDDNLQSTANYGKVRSCFVFNSQELREPVMKSLFSNFKLLKALDFEDACLDSLPKAVKNLFLLKYLNLRNTRIKTIPKFIGKLLNLETLDLKHTLVCELPVDIYRLVKLRHLIAYYFRRKADSSVENIQGVKLEKGVECLKALQKLSKVDTTDGDEVIKELGKLKCMRRLGITKLRRRNGNLLCSAIESMVHLQSLSIEAEDNEVLDLHSMIYPPQYLQRLHLKGRLARLPKWISKLKSLVKLCLTWSRLEEDPLFILKDLSELEFLDLYKSYEGDELHCENNWFKNLKVLKLQGMQRLRKLKLDNGALPCLEELQLVSCSEMFEVPSDIQNLRKLKLLRFEDMPDQFGMHMQENGLDILRHIPSVIYFMDGYNLPIFGTSIPSMI